MSGTHKKERFQNYYLFEIQYLTFCLAVRHIVTLSNRSATCLFFLKVKSSPIISSGLKYTTINHTFTHMLCRQNNIINETVLAGTMPAAWRRNKRFSVHVSVRFTSVGWAQRCRSYKVYEWGLVVYVFCQNSN